jgi:hypothetical protein
VNDVVGIWPLVGESPVVIAKRAIARNDGGAHAFFFREANEVGGVGRITHEGTTIAACPIRKTKPQSRLVHRQRLIHGNDKLDGDQNDNDNFQTQCTLGVDNVGQNLCGIRDHRELA